MKKIITQMACTLVYLMIAMPAVSCSRNGSQPSSGELLFEAIAVDDVAKISKLMKQVDPKELNGEFIEGRTVLAVAVEYEACASIRALLDSGADPLVTSKSNIYVTGKEMLPIEIAARYPLKNVLITLVEHKSSANYTQSDRESVKKIIISGHDKQLSEQILNLLNENSFFE